MIRLVPGVLVFVLWVYCLVDVITSREDGVRNLAKGLWILIVLFFPLVGSVAWFVAGRPRAERPLTRSEGAAPGFPEYERPGRFAAADPEKDDEFLRGVRERAEEQRRRYEQQQREQQPEQGGGERDRPEEPDAV